MVEIIFVTVLLTVALLMGYFRPLSRKYKIAEGWEMAVATLGAVLFCIYLAARWAMPAFIEADLAKAPCGPNSPQGACYSLTQDVCTSAWQNADVTCRTEVAEIQRNRPSALIGPALNRCKARKMDHTLRYNRKNESSPYCKAYFDYLAGH